LLEQQFLQIVFELAVKKLMPRGWQYSAAVA